MFGIGHLGQVGRIGGVIRPPGLIIPPGVVAAGSQLGYAQRNITGWRTPPTKILGDGTGGTTLPPSGWGFGAGGRAGSILTLGHSPDPLDGFDTNGRYVLINHNNAEVRDSRVWHSQAWGGSGGYGIRISDGAAVDNTLIEYTEVDGQGETLARATPINFGIGEHTGYVATRTTVRGVYIHGIGGDPLNIWSAGALIEYNRLPLGGWRSITSHADLITLKQRVGTGRSIVRYNSLDFTPVIDPAYTGGADYLDYAHTFGRTSVFGLSEMTQGVDIYGNDIFGAEVADNGWWSSTGLYANLVFLGPQARPIQIYSSGTNTADVNFYNNSFSGPYTGEQITAGTTSRIGIEIWTDNYRRDTGAAISRPNRYPTLATLTLSANSIAEKSAPGTVVGALQSLTAGSSRSLFDDADGQFALSGSNVVTGLVETDFETDPNPAIIVEEYRAGASGNPKRTTLTINVTDVAEGPTTDAAITGVRAEGWTVDFTSPPTMDPVGAPKYVALLRQGFDSSAASVTVSEALVLTKRVRLPYSSTISGNYNNLDASRVSLSDYVYSTDTLVGGSASNNSTEVSPKPIVRWAKADRRTVGNSLRLEIVAAHRNARSREEIAAVKFIATDGTNTVTQTVSTSSILGASTDRYPVVGYAVDLDISTLTEGSITVNAEVYPWIGGAASVAKSADTAADSRSFSAQIYRKNVSKAANPPLAYISTTGTDATVLASGATSGGTQKVSTDATTARANPFATFVSAMAAMLAATSVTGGSVDGSEIRYMDGTHAVATPAVATYSTVSEITFAADPLGTAGAAIINMTANWATRCTYFRLRKLRVNRTTAAQFTLVNNARMTFEDVTYANSTSNFAILAGPAAGSPGVLRIEGGTFLTTASTALLAGSVTSDVSSFEVRLARGLNVDNNLTLDPWCVLGSYMVNPALVCVSASQEGGILGYNRFLCASASISAISCGTRGACDGFAVLQCLLEVTAVAAAPPYTLPLRLSADANVGNVTHLVVHHNTLTGFDAHGRSNILYSDTPATNRTHKLASFVGNIHSQINTKQDVFAAAAANVNAWAYHHGVGCRGEFSQFLDAGGGGVIGGYRDYAQDYPGLNANRGTSNSARNDPLFTNYQGPTSNTAGTAPGGGDYTLQAGSPAIGLVTSPVLRFDLSGAARGTTASAAGAYERTA